MITSINGLICPEGITILYILLIPAVAVHVFETLYATILLFESTRGVISLLLLPFWSNCSAKFKSSSVSKYCPLDETTRVPFLIIGAKVQLGIPSVDELLYAVFCRRRQFTCKFKFCHSTLRTRYSKAVTPRKSIYRSSKLC